jgi:Mrp family chromosome partitioning ATPase
MVRSAGSGTRAPRIVGVGLVILLLMAALMAGALRGPAAIASPLRAGVLATWPIAAALIAAMVATFVGLMIWRSRLPLAGPGPAAEEPLLTPGSLPAVLGRCPVIGLMGVESGVGATTLAFNLAVATAVEGRLPSTATRSGRPRPICLLTEGALSESLGVSADALTDLLLQNVGRVPDEVVSLAKRHPSGVEMLALAPGKVNVEQLRRLLELLRRHYDAVVIDCPRGDLWLEEIVTQVVDALLIVALPTEKSAGESRRWLDRLWSQRAEQRSAVVVNGRTVRQPPADVTRGFVHSVHISAEVGVADLDSRGIPWILDLRLAPTRELKAVAGALMPGMFGEMPAHVA